jgi:hypothetical protein
MRTPPRPLRQALATRKLPARTDTLHTEAADDPGVRQIVGM